jgi:hypothetical protein
MGEWEYNWWDDRTIEPNFCPVLNDFCYEGNDACKNCIMLKAFQEYYDRRHKD